MSAPALIKKSATSVNPPQHAKVRAVSWVSSVWALILAPAIQYTSKIICENLRCFIYRYLITHYIRFSGMENIN
jgi:hypothetical protein